MSAVNLDEGRESISLRHAIRKGTGGRWEEAELKTHQRRRLAIDSETSGPTVVSATSWSRTHGGAC